MKNFLLALLALVVSAAIVAEIVIQAPHHPGAVRRPLRAAPPGERHRVGVRISGGVGEFFDRKTRRRFVPRGANYIRLALQRTNEGGRILYHSTFNVGAYDRTRVEGALEKMRAKGYNTVRVFLGPVCPRACLGDDKTGGISSAYVANVVDFLRRAEANRVQVLLTVDGVPGRSRYAGLVTAGASERISGANASYLTEQGVEANAEFWQDVVSELNVQDASLGAILGYELRNEFAYTHADPPLTLRSGSVRTANGRTYSLASPSERERMLDENLSNWIGRVRAAIRLLDPSALIGIGFSGPHSTARAAIAASDADFVDLHTYPGVGPSLREAAARLGLARPARKALLIGEEGAFKSLYPSPLLAAHALVVRQYESCRYGFAGWMLWTWDTYEQPSLWTALSANGVIGRTLSPKVRPNPCAPVSR